ncbi:MAG: hypothetical protein OEL88_15380 [Sterolibacteriaceae bacterium MAG5]|nr:hypothetical protein [Candidatus Nitricoxidireducens bremensis]
MTTRTSDQEAIGTFTCAVGDDTDGSFVRNQPRLKNGQLAADGFAALTDLDGNQDGQLDNRDTIWADIKLWRDVDSDGRGDAGELLSLAEDGFAGIATGHSAGIGSDSHSNQYLQQCGLMRADGSSGQMEGIWFCINVKSLPVAYQENPGLKQAAADLKAQGGLAAQRGFETFLAQWTGLTAAHQAKGVTRTGITREDKVWMLETLTRWSAADLVGRIAPAPVNEGSDTIYGFGGADGLSGGAGNDGQWRIAA